LPVPAATVASYGCAGLPQSLFDCGTGRSDINHNHWHRNYHI